MHLEVCVSARVLHCAFLDVDVARCAAPNHVQLLRNIERSEARVPAELLLSPACTALLRGLLQRNPVERISFEEFFGHEFLASPAAHPAAGPAMSADSASRREGHTPNVSAASTAADAASKASVPLPFELPGGGDSDGEVTSPAAAALPFAFHHRDHHGGGPALGRGASAGPRGVPSAGAVRGQAPLQARLDALPGPGTPTGTAGGIMLRTREHLEQLLSSATLHRLPLHANFCVCQNCFKIEMRYVCHPSLEHI